LFFCRAANQHIEMISEGSCDTEDWSNYAENSKWLWLGDSRQDFKNKHLFSLE